MRLGNQWIDIISHTIMQCKGGLVRRAEVRDESLNALESVDHVRCRGVSNYGGLCWPKTYCNCDPRSESPVTADYCM